MEPERYATAQHECPRSQAFPVIGLDLDESVSAPHVIDPAARADHAAGFQDTGGQRPVEARAVKDGDLFARIVELCDPTAW